MEFNYIEYMVYICNEEKKTLGIVTLPIFILDIYIDHFPGLYRLLIHGTSITGPCSTAAVRRTSGRDSHGQWDDGT